MFFLLYIMTGQCSHNNERACERHCRRHLFRKRSNHFYTVFNKSNKLNKNKHLQCHCSCRQPWRDRFRAAPSLPRTKAPQIAKKQKTETRTIFLRQLTNNERETESNGNPKNHTNEQDRNTKPKSNQIRKNQTTANGNAKIPYKHLKSIRGPTNNDLVFSQNINYFGCYLYCFDICRVWYIGM